MAGRRVLVPSMGVRPSLPDPCGVGAAASISDCQSDDPGSSPGPRSIILLLYDCRYRPIGQDHGFVSRKFQFDSGCLLHFNVSETWTERKTDEQSDEQASASVERKL